MKSFWTWAIIIAILALVVWYFFFRTPKVDTTTQAAVAA